MQKQQILSFVTRYRLLIPLAVLLMACVFVVNQVQAAAGQADTNERLITIHDRDKKRVVLTKSQTIGDALAEANITTNDNDIVEPATTNKLLASSYTVNIYRARPVTVVDGMVRQKIMTAAQTAKDMATAAGMSLHDEDKTTVTPSQDIIADGAGVVLAVDRATAFTLTLYGKPSTAYSHEKTVGDMLIQKGIKLAANDTVSVPLETPLATGLAIHIWREGVQTATVEEEVDFPIRTVLDADRPIGSKEIQTPGVKGKKDVVYEITVSDGKEISRKAIQSVVTQQPTDQVVVEGAKVGNGLTKSKGAGIFTDSKGVAHRETYYDLPMNIVMNACGGGNYTIRFDGAKIDKDGYILVAAHLGNYPRCSIVETSIGLGKVYDTGGFTAKHPHGFDLATDWTNGDGR